MSPRAMYPHTVALDGDLDLDPTNWSWIHCLTFPLQTLNTLRLSQNGPATPSESSLEQREIFRPVLTRPMLWTKIASFVVGVIV